MRLDCYQMPISDALYFKQASLFFKQTITPTHPPIQSEEYFTTLRMI